MTAVALFLLENNRRTEHNTHFCMPLKPVFTGDCGDGLHFTDEPTGNLDAVTAEEITAILKESAHAFGKCVVVVTHGREVAKQADVVLEIKRGHLTERNMK